ncbi:ABC transporter permease [Roseococcus sp. YIM B11640]|uniref:ABC transporter permease n=1 Tax=Roseococcus sp. YIM B11640 TaxID=3133973 RepID=UPI003C79D419
MSATDSIIAPAAEPMASAPVVVERSSLTDHPAARILLPALFAVVMIGLWEGLVIWYAVPEVILPTPSRVYQRILQTWPFLLQHAVPTGLDSLFGFIIATILGMGIALVLTYSKWAYVTLYPNVVLLQLIPKIALAPLFIVWLGIGTSSRLAFSVFIAFFPVVIATQTGLNSTPPDMIRLCKALTARSWQVFLSVRFPYALPHIFSGLKIAVTFAIIGVIVGEFITAQAGLGYLVLFASSQAETALVLASIAMLCVVGLVLYGIVAGLERIVLRKYGH